MVLGDGEILAPIYGLKEGGSELQMSGFEFVNMADCGLKMKGTPHIYSHIIAMK